MLRGGVRRVTVWQFPSGAQQGLYRYKQPPFTQQETDLKGQGSFVANALEEIRELAYIEQKTSLDQEVTRLPFLLILPLHSGVLLHLTNLTFSFSLSSPKEQIFGKPLLF